MTTAQVVTIDGLLWNLGGPAAPEVRRLVAAHAHSGDCVGGDAQFHALAVKHGLWTVGHPPLDRVLRAFCEYDEERSPTDPLVRNSAIVEECTVVFAAPKTPVEQVRSGTWATIRRARLLDKPMLVVLPGGHAAPNDAYVRWMKAA